jgi:hypothetical protein
MTHGHAAIRCALCASLLFVCTPGCGPTFKHLAIAGTPTITECTLAQYFGLPLPACRKAARTRMGPQVQHDVRPLRLVQ